jgi:hypothetical protein
VLGCRNLVPCLPAGRHRRPVLLAQCNATWALGKPLRPTCEKS